MELPVISDVSNLAPSPRPSGLEPPPDEFDRDEMLRALWTSLAELRMTVENDHDHRLRRIEADLRWVTILLGAEIVALISASIATIAAG